MTTTKKDSKDFYKMLDKLKQEADKEAEEFNKTLEELKKKADAEEDYQGGGAYRAFLELFYKNKIEDDKKK